MIMSKNAYLAGTGGGRGSSLANLAEKSGDHSIVRSNPAAITGLASSNNSSLARVSLFFNVKNE